ncbi:MAG: DUF1295 domain-containing protein [Bradymonadia bacterium]
MSSDTNGQTSDSMSNLACLVTVAISLVGIVVLAYLGGHQQIDGALMQLAVVAVAIQWVAFLPAVMWRTEMFYDIVGSATFIVLVWAAVYLKPSGPLTTPQVIPACLVTVWALRLATFLGRRIKKVGKDGRFDDIKTNGIKFFMSWTLQALWNFLTALPVLLVILAPDGPEGVGSIHMIGWSIWLLGFCIEVIADRQKSIFRARGDSASRWIDTGLWARAQHPNYFGEITLWTGLFIAGTSTYAGGEWVASIAPVFVYILLTRISGIPMLRARAQARWGDNPEYQAYMAKTPMLLPLGRR